MNDIQVGRYSQLLHKLLEMAEGSPAPTLAPELFAMLALEVDRPEWLFPSGAKACSATAIEGAGVGARSIAALHNPTGSGVLACIQRVEVQTTASYILIEPVFGNNVSAFDVDGTNRMTDTRWGVTGLGFSGYPSCRLLTDTRAVMSATGGRWFPVDKSDGTNYHYFLEQPWVLAPNSALCFTPATDNAVNRIQIYWREWNYTRMELQGANPRLR